VAAAGAVAARSRRLVPGAVVGLRVLPAVAGGRGWPAGEDVVQQAGEAVLLGALAVQGGLVAGELVAQRGDGVVRGGQLRGRGGEGGVVPLLVLLADAGGVSADCLGCGQGGVTLAAGDGDGLFCFGDPGCGSPAFVVQRAAGVTCEFFGMLAGGGLSFHRGDGLGCCGAGLSSVQLGGVPGDRLAGGLGAGLPDLGGGLGAHGLSLRFGSLGVAGRGQLAAEGSELVQDGCQLRAQPAHRGERVVADGPGPADGRGDRPVLARLPGQLLAVPECGHGGVPDQHRRAVPTVFGDLLLAVAGPGTRGGRVLNPGRASASRVPADARRTGCLRPVSGPGLDRSRHRSCPSCWPCPGTAERDEIRRNAMKWIAVK